MNLSTSKPTPRIPNNTRYNYHAPNPPPKPRPPSCSRLVPLYLALISFIPIHIHSNNPVKASESDSKIPKPLWKHYLKHHKPPNSSNSTKSSHQFIFHPPKSKKKNLHPHTETHIAPKIYLFNLRANHFGRGRRKNHVNIETVTKMESTQKLQKRTYEQCAIADTLPPLPSSKPKTTPSDLEKQEQGVRHRTKTRGTS